MSQHQDFCATEKSQTWIRPLPTTRATRNRPRRKVRELNPSSTLPADPLPARISRPGRIPPGVQFATTIAHLGAPRANQGGKPHRHRQGEPRNRSAPPRSAPNSSVSCCDPAAASKRAAVVLVHRVDECGDSLREHRARDHVLACSRARNESRAISSGTEGLPAPAHRRRAMHAAALVLSFADECGFA